MAQNSILELAVCYNFQYGKKSCSQLESWFTSQIVAPYYFKSTRASALADYFLPGCKDCVLIGQNNTSDISSLWLQIASQVNTPYESQLCLAPSRSVIGAALRMVIDVSKWVADSDNPAGRFWFSFFMPIQQVTHRLNIAESVNAQSGNPIVPPSFANAIDALNNPEWKYAALSNKALRKTGIDTICAKLGYNFSNQINTPLSAYALVFIPTGKGTQSKNLFEPLVGSCHTGLGFGANAEKIIARRPDTTYTFLCDARYAYFLKADEMRTFDLYNGQWSRFLLVASPELTTVPLPGVNYLTQKVTVKPRSMFEFWGAIGIAHGNWYVECGYDLWVRSAENISLDDKNLNVGIYDIAFDGNLACPVSASCATICQSIPNTSGSPASDGQFVAIINSNISSLICNRARPNQIEQLPAECCSVINLKSGAHPRSSSSSIYGSVGYDYCIKNQYPFVIALGAQYEIGHNRNALSQYGVWLKASIGFGDLL